MSNCNFFPCNGKNCHRCHELAVCNQPAPKPEPEMLAKRTVLGEPLGGVRAAMARLEERAVEEPK